jgi:hypothetical protein
MALSVGNRLGAYEVLAFIGKGGMGVSDVWAEKSEPAPRSLSSFPMVCAGEDDLLLLRSLLASRVIAEFVRIGIDR